MAMAVTETGEVIETRDDANEHLRATFESFLGGDNGAFAELYRELNPRLSAYAHKIAAAHADDLMQELWERVIALRNKKEFSPFSRRGQEASPTVRTINREVVNPTAFLFRMLKNLAIDEHRRSRPLQEAVVSIEDAPWAEGQWAEGQSYASGEQSDLEAVILEAFEKLPDGDKELLVLNIYSGYKFGEIAEMLGKSVDAVWQHASRARARLREIVMQDARCMGIALPELKSKPQFSELRKTRDA